MANVPGSSGPEGPRSRLVLGRFHKMHNMAARGGSGCFCCFLQRFISDRHLVLRGNPRLPMVRRSEKQRDGLGSAAVLRCFVAQMQPSQGVITKRSRLDDFEGCHTPHDIKLGNICQFDK